jgi:hypothetical protein
VFGTAAGGSWLIGPLAVSGITPAAGELAGEVRVLMSIEDLLGVVGGNLESPLRDT